MPTLRTKRPFTWLRRLSNFEIPEHQPVVAVAGGKRGRRYRLSGVPACIPKTDYSFHDAVHYGIYVEADNVEVVPTGPYAWVTDEMFDAALQEIVNERHAEILTVPGVYEVLCEHYNNDVLVRLEEARNQEGEQHE